MTTHRCLTSQFIMRQSTKMIRHSKFSWMLDCQSQFYHFKQQKQQQMLIKLQAEDGDGSRPNKVIEFEIVSASHGSWDVSPSGILSLKEAVDREAFLTK